MTLLVGSILIGWLTASNAQAQSNTPVNSEKAGDRIFSQLPSPANWIALTKGQEKNSSQVTATSLAQRQSTWVGQTAAPLSEPTIAPTGTRRITLEQAKQQATAGDNPMARLAQFQVEAAKQHTLGAKADFFPKISSTFTNFHFNKFMGERIAIIHPILGITTTAGLPLAGKDQTLVAATVMQPLTPLFKLHEVLNIARADERIARAKAGMPVTETARNVEKAYYEALIAQRQLAAVKANATGIESKWLVASNSALPDTAESHKAELIETSKALAIATGKVKESIAALNEMLGWPPDTDLELVPPDPVFEEISLQKATDKAIAANAEVVEAEQTVVKAKAASSLSKLDYVPDVAVIGGYSYQKNAIPLLPPDFSFIGVMASYNLFDFGKRERTVKERSSQLAMAETALQLTKAKVAAGVKKSHFELERTRQLSELTRRLASAAQLLKASYQGDNWELVASRAKIEAEMFQADLDYCQALARLKALMVE